MRNTTRHFIGPLVAVAASTLGLAGPCAVHHSRLFAEAPAHQFSPTESLVDIRAEAKFTDSPHPVTAYWSGDDGWHELEWIAKPETMLKLKEYHADKILVLFKGFFQNSGADRIGVGTINGRYVWKDPSGMRRWIRYMRDVLGFDVYIYMAPSAWRGDNLTSRQFLDEAIKLRRWSGGDLHLYLDGYGFGSGVGASEETFATLSGLHARGFKLYIHGSIAPGLGSNNAGREAEFRMPGAKLATVFLHGETNLPKTHLLNWFRGTSYLQHPHVNTIHKPAKPKKDEDGKIIHASPTFENPALNAYLSHRYMMIWRIDKRNLDAFETHYWPTYKVEREAFENDRISFVKKKARAFGQ